MRTRQAAGLAGALLFSVVMLNQCQVPALEVPGSAETTSEPDIATLLPGVWLREYKDDRAQVQRLLTLEPDGRFEEEVRVTLGDGAQDVSEHEGRWYFDGSNLKRRYTRMNGVPPMLRLKDPYSTFEISFDGRDHFTGVNHVYRAQVRYERVSKEFAQTLKAQAAAR